MTDIDHYGALHIINSDEENETFNLKRAKTTFGKNIECDVKMWKSPYLSDRQCEINFDKRGQATCSNIGSNDIQINGVALKQTQSRMLNDNDVIIIFDHEFRFTYSDNRKHFLMTPSPKKSITRPLSPSLKTNNSLQATPADLKSLSPVRISPRRLAHCPAAKTPRDAREDESPTSSPFIAAASTHTPRLASPALRIAETRTCPLVRNIRSPSLASLPTSRKPVNKPNVESLCGTSLSSNEHPLSYEAYKDSSRKDDIPAEIPSSPFLARVEPLEIPHDARVAKLELANSSIPEVTLSPARSLSFSPGNKWSVPSRNPQSPSRLQVTNLAQDSPSSGAGEHSLILPEFCLRQSLSLSPSIDNTILNAATYNNPSVGAGEYNPQSTPRGVPALKPSLAKPSLPRLPGVTPPAFFQKLSQEERRKLGIYDQTETDENSYPVMIGQKSSKAEDLASLRIAPARFKRTDSVTSNSSDMNDLAAELDESLQAENNSILKLKDEDSSFKVLKDSDFDVRSIPSPYADLLDLHLKESSDVDNTEHVFKRPSSSRSQFAPGPQSPVGEVPSIAGQKRAASTPMDSGRPRKRRFIQGSPPAPLVSKRTRGTPGDADRRFKKLRTRSPIKSSPLKNTPVHSAAEVPNHELVENMDDHIPIDGHTIEVEQLQQSREYLSQELFGEEPRATPRTSPRKHSSPIALSLAPIELTPVRLSPRKAASYQPPESSVLSRPSPRKQHTEHPSSTPNRASPRKVASTPISLTEETPSSSPFQVPVNQSTSTRVSPRIVSDNPLLFESPVTSSLPGQQTPVEEPHYQQNSSRRSPRNLTANSVQSSFTSRPVRESFDPQISPRKNAAANRNETITQRFLFPAVADVDRRESTPQFAALLQMTPRMSLPAHASAGPATDNQVISETVEFAAVPTKKTSSPLKQQFAVIQEPMQTVPKSVYEDNISFTFSEDNSAGDEIVQSLLSPLPKIARQSTAVHEFTDEANDSIISITGSDILAAINDTSSIQHVGNEHKNENVLYEETHDDTDQNYNEAAQHGCERPVAAEVVEQYQAPSAHEDSFELLCNQLGEEAPAVAPVQVPNTFEEALEMTQDTIEESALTGLSATDDRILETPIEEQPAIQEALIPEKIIGGELQVLEAAEEMEQIQQGQDNITEQLERNEEHVFHSTDIPQSAIVEEITQKPDDIIEGKFEGELTFQCEMIIQETCEEATVEVGSPLLIQPPSQIRDSLSRPLSDTESSLESELSTSTRKNLEKRTGSSPVVDMKERQTEPNNASTPAQQTNEIVRRGGIATSRGNPTKPSNQPVVVVESKPRKKRTRGKKVALPQPEIVVEVTTTGFSAEEVGENVQRMKEPGSETPLEHLSSDDSQVFVETQDHIEENTVAELNSRISRRSRAAQSSPYIETSQRALSQPSTDDKAKKTSRRRGRKPRAEKVELSPQPETVDVVQAENNSVIGSVPAKQGRDRFSRRTTNNQSERLQTANEMPSADSVHEKETPLEKLSLVLTEPVSTRRPVALRKASNRITRRGKEAKDQPLPQQEEFESIGVEGTNKSNSANQRTSRRPLDNNHVVDLTGDNSVVEELPENATSHRRRQTKNEFFTPTTEPSEATQFAQKSDRSRRKADVAGSKILVDTIAEPAEAKDYSSQPQKTTRSRKEKLKHLDSLSEDPLVLEEAPKRAGRGRKRIVIEDPSLKPPAKLACLRRLSDFSEKGQAVIKSAESATKPIRGRKRATALKTSDEVPMDLDQNARNKSAPSPILEVSQGAESTVVSTKPTTKHGRGKKAALAQEPELELTTLEESTQGTMRSSRRARKVEPSSSQQVEEQVVKGFVLTKERHGKAKQPVSEADAVNLSTKISVNVRGKKATERKTIPVEDHILADKPMSKRVSRKRGIESASQVEEPVAKTRKRNTTNTQTELSTDRKTKAVATKPAVSLRRSRKT